MTAATTTAIIVDASGKTPEQFLAESDQAFAAGEYDDGSELLFQAVAGALSQLAADYGHPCATREELRAFARWLDEKHGLDRYYTRDLMVALTYHDNAVYHFIPPDEVEFCRPVVRKFVAALLSSRQKAARYG